MKSSEKFYLVRVKNSPFYQIIHIKANGRRTKKTTGTKIKAEALKFLSEYREEIRKKRIQVKTLSGFRDEYLQLIGSTKSKSYQRSVALSLKQLLNFLSSDLALSDITVKQIEEFISLTYKSAEYSARLYYRTLKAAFNKALAWGYIETNPFKSVKLPKAKNNLPVFLTDEELAKIIEATKEKVLRDVFTFAFYTGARLGEICALRAKHIDTKQGLIFIRSEADFVTKGKTERAVPAHAKIIPLLFSAIARKKENDYLFSKAGNIKFNTEYISKKFKKAVRLAGLDERFHFHSLRHSFGSALAQQNHSPLIVKELLGHSDIKTSLIYSHLQRENLVKAVQSIGNNIEKKEAKGLGDLLKIQSLN